MEQNFYQKSKNFKKWDKQKTGDLFLNKNNAKYDIQWIKVVKEGHILYLTAPWTQVAVAYFIFPYDPH